MAFRASYDHTTAADHFQRYARSAATYLVVASLIAIALGLLLGALNVWEQHERFTDFGESQSFRFYMLNFFSSLGTYALVAAILFAGGMLVSSIASFQLALAADFAALNEEPNRADEPTPGPPNAR